MARSARGRGLQNGAPRCLQQGQGGALIKLKRSRHCATNHSEAMGRKDSVEPLIAIAFGGFWPIRKPCPARFPLSWHLPLGALTGVEALGLACRCTSFTARLGCHVGHPTAYGAPFQRLGRCLGEMLQVMQWLTPAVVLYHEHERHGRHIANTAIAATGCSKDGMTPMRWMKHKATLHPQTLAPGWVGPDKVSIQRAASRQNRLQPTNVTEEKPCQSRILRDQIAIGTMV
jgi:hypothetical protein